MGKPGRAWRNTERANGWLTLADASAETGIAASTLRGWAIADKIVSKKVGGIVFVSLSSLGEITSGTAKETA